jgi:hypothetical protein
VTAFYPNSDFYTYKAGVYTWDGRSAQVGGHAVLVVGYNDAEGWWLAKNSCKFHPYLLGCGMHDTELSGLRKSRNNSRLVNPPCMITSAGPLWMQGAPDGVRHMQTSLVAMSGLPMDTQAS